MSASDAEEKPIQLVIASPLVPQDSILLIRPSPEVKEVDPRHQKHCVNAHIVGPDQSYRPVKVLRDTGALQSLV